MKTADVRIGEIYLCKVGDRLARVVVVEHLTGEMHSSGRKGPDVFRLRREGAAIDLPKRRTAGALREALPFKPGLPADYEPCGVCGFDHGYEQQEANTAHAMIPEVPPTEPNPVKTGVIVSQEYYLSCAENRIGWCTTCQAFRGEDLEPDSRDLVCPECHKPTLYGAELALSTGLIDPKEDE